MKLYFTLIIAFFIPVFTLLASSGPDTLIIRLSELEELKIISSSGNELEELSKYDLNQIIRELQERSEDETDTQTVIVMEDETGSRYMLNQSDDDSDEESELSSKIERLEIELERLVDDIERKEENRDEEEEKVDFNKSKRKRTSNSFVFEFGLNNYMNEGQFPDADNELFTVNPFTSWYVSLGSMNSTHLAGPLSLDWGANVSWYNFKFDNERTRVLKTDDGVLFFEDTNTDFEPIKSKIVVPYINLTLVPMLIFDKKKGKKGFPTYHENDGFRIGLGAYGGYRIGGRSKSVIRNDGDRERDKDRENFYFNNWRYGARLQLGYMGVDIFANYDMNELFIPGRGPQLNAFSFGIIL